MLALALALRVGACAWWQSRLPPGSRFEFGDSDAYWTLARQIATGQPYQYGSPDARVFRAPGYPLLLAPLFLVANDPAAIWGRWISAACGTLAVAGVYALAARLYDRNTGLLAAAIAACYPGAIAVSSVVLSESPFCLLMVAQLAAWVASWHTSGNGRSLAWSAASGCLAGLATLVRPSWLLFVPLALAIGLVLCAERRRMFVAGLVILAAMMVTMLPWWFRNAAVVGHFVPTTLQVGASLYDGLNPQADGSSQMDFVPEFERHERRSPSDGDEPFEYRLDRRLRHAAIDWAREHPAKVSALVAVKFTRMWNVWPNNREQRGWLVRVLCAATYVPVMVLANVGVWRMRGNWWPVALCWLPAVYLTLLHVVFVSSIRYREPAMLGLIVLAAAAVRKH